MLFLNLLVYRYQKPDWFRNSLLGLSIGCTLLIRSELFLIPFAILLLDLVQTKKLPAAPPTPAGRRIRQEVINAATLIAFSYVLLLPWLGVTYYLNKTVIPFESQRGTCNMITGAMGSVYTMEGDCRNLAGLSPQDNAFAWAAHRILSAPHKYLISVLKRLLHIFYMFPVLFLLAAAGYFLCRRKEVARPAAMLVLYFVLLHSLVSIEPRYFYSLRYVLSFMGALVLCRFTDTGNDGKTPVFTLGVFGCSLLPVLLLEAVLVSYPFRAKPELTALEAALGAFSDPWLWEKRGDYLCRDGRTGDGIDSYYRTLETSGGKDMRMAYILATLKSPAGAEIKPPDAALGLETQDSWVLKSLKELETGETTNARRSLWKAYELWNGQGNMLRGTPYKTDTEILLKIQETNGIFWDYHILNCLYYWPPEKRRVLVQRLSKITQLTPELKKFL